MVKLNAFSRLKNIFSRLNHLDSFKWGKSDDESVVLPSQKELLKDTIKKYPEFKKVVLMAVYHLRNTMGKNNEYLTVLTKDNRLIVDLLEGNENDVKVPLIVEIEAKKDNVLVVCHNHFFGAIIPSLDDVATALDNNCKFVVIVSCNNIGVIIIESDEIESEIFVRDFECLREYIGFCMDNEKYRELDEIDLMDISEEEREKIKSIIFDKFLSDNVEKFVNEFNIRFNRYKIYEIYINL